MISALQIGKMWKEGLGSSCDLGAVLALPSCTKENRIALKFMAPSGLMAEVLPCGLFYLVGSCEIAACGHEVR
jgi:hypothetical protein